MKIEGMPGQFGFKAAWKRIDKGHSWELSETYFFTEEEAKNGLDDATIKVMWPVEELDNGGIYIPAPEELE